MRTLVSILLSIAVVIGVMAIYLVATTPNEAHALRFPLDAAQRDMLQRVPASADAFALIPTAAVLHRKLKANPVTRDTVDQWSATQPLPPAWLLGGADVIVWKQGRTTSYAIRLDTIRAFLVRVWMMSSTEVQAEWDGSMFVFNPSSGSTIARSTLDELLALANGLPEGDILAVQRSSARGAFPPIGRPAVSSVRVTETEILLTSRARAERDVVATAPSQARFPRGALIAATFAEPPRLLGDLRRIAGIDVSSLARNGGVLALYDIETRTLLPRPRGVIAVPANAETRASMQRLAGFAELVGESRDTGSELVVSFDRESAGMYLKDASVPATWPANRWALRLDAARMVPILEELGDSRGLQLAAGRLHRAARDLRKWISALDRAESIEAADSITGGVEELRVRIASK